MTLFACIVSSLAVLLVGYWAGIQDERKQWLKGRDNV